MLYMHIYAIQYNTWLWWSLQVPPPPPLPPVVLILRCPWHHLQAQAGAKGGAADVGGHPIRHLDTQPSQELQYIQLFIMLLYRIA